MTTRATPSACQHAMGPGWIVRNLDAVRTGAMVHDVGADDELLRLGLIGRNASGDWYDLTPAGAAHMREVQP